MSVRHLRILTAFLAFFFLIFFAGCMQRIKTEAVQYPSYWKSEGFGQSKNVTMSVEPGSTKNLASEHKDVNKAFAVVVSAYINKYQKILKVVDSDNTDLRLVITVNKVLNVEKNEQTYRDEVVYKKDEYGFPITDKNGNKIPVWKTDKYGRHLYNDEGEPLIKTERVYYTIIYREVGFSGIAELYNKSNKKIDTLKFDRSYWSKGANPESEAELTLKSMAKITEDIYARFSPNTFTLNISDDNLCRTAAKELDNEGNYVMTNSFADSDQAALIILKLPSNAAENEFGIVIVPAGGKINNPDDALYSKTFVWNGNDEQLILEFSPAELYSRTDGKNKYELHLTKDNKSLLNETIKINPPKK